MSRISLYEKLSRREDFKEILKRVKVSSNQLRYLKDNFLCTNQTASRFLDEMRIHSVKSLKEGEPAEDIITLRAQAELSSFEDDIKYRNPTLSLVSFGERLEKFKPTLVYAIFKLLNNGVCASIKKKEILIRAIKYMLQVRFYNEMYKIDVPESVLQTKNGLVTLCVTT